MARVFISHANVDREATEEVHRWLVEAGHEVFLDRDLRGGLVAGEEWEQRLNERLRWADAVVCVVTSAFLASKWCLYEVGYARSQGSRLLSVRAERGVDHPLVKVAHYADLVDDPVAGRAVLVEALRRVNDLGGYGWPDGKSPFPGLRPLDVDEHRVFFGRSWEVRQLAQWVRSPTERAVLLVVGPSGCGKSSLVRAGLLHVMADEPGWRTLAPMLPGVDPVSALARELTLAAQRLGLDWTLTGVRQRLEEAGLSGLADELLLANPGGHRRLLVVVDQFEELLTQTPPEHRTHFARLLCPALRGPVQVVATLRTEFLDQLRADPDLAVLPTHPYALRPLHHEALRIVIEGPARLAGINVDDELVARAVADTNGGEALPLLAFTLAQLADGISRGGQLSSARYDQLGGVRGALVRQADAALTDAIAASGRSDDEVVAGLLWLVTVDEQGCPTRRRVSHDELAEPVTRELDAFVTRRLVTTDTANGGVVVGVAHEAFLTVWAPLAQAITIASSPLRARRALEQATTEWNDHGRSPDRLWERGRLAAAVSDTGARIQAHDLLTDHIELSSRARTFLHASMRRDLVRRRRARIAVLAALLVLALAAAAGVVVQQRNTEQRDVLVSQRIAAKAMELHASNPALAALLSLAVYRLAPTTTEARDSLLNTFTTTYATLLTGYKDGIYSMAFSPDGGTLATGDGNGFVWLWDVHDPHHSRLVKNFRADNTYLQAVAFSPDGNTLITGSFHDDARLWDVSDPNNPHQLSTLPGRTNGVFSVTFSLDRRTLATGNGDGNVRLWYISDPRRPRLVKTFPGHTRAVNSMAFSTDGRTLATGSNIDDARLWDVSDVHQPLLLGLLPSKTKTKGVYSVAFSSDRRTLATGDDDATVRLWDVSDLRQPSLLKTLTGHSKPVLSVTFSADGHTLATGSYDHTVRLWDVKDPHQPQLLDILTGHDKGVFSVAFSPKRHTLATGSDDMTVRLWDIPGPTMISNNMIDNTNGVHSVAFSPDKRTVATGDGDGTVRLWTVNAPLQPSPLDTLPGHTGPVFSVAFSPDGHTLATGSDDGVRLWNVSDPRQPSLVKTLPGDTKGFSVAFSSDKRTLATGGFDGTVRLWDVSNPRRSHSLGSVPANANRVFSVAFSPDGHTLATGSDDGVRLWNASDPRQPRLVKILPGYTKGVSSVAFSNNGHTLATGSDDTTVRLWNVSDPHQPSLVGTLTRHTQAVWSVAFSTDGHTLVTGGLDDKAQLWETNFDSIATRICTSIPASTENQLKQYLPELSYRSLCP